VLASIFNRISVIEIIGGNLYTIIWPKKLIHFFLYEIVNNTINQREIEKEQRRLGFTLQLTLLNKIELQEIII
jgi:hypothetical protein